jgi:catechol 2,3-dioxygenase-like lactoylglutathione lyase family enzyme
MARPTIRHLAIFARNPKKMAHFYETAFAMEVINKAKDDTAFFLSDGYLTLAILPHRLEGEAAAGLNHFGFEIEDMVSVKAKLAEFGLEEPRMRPAERPYAEFRACDPEGNQFDLSVHGFNKTETGHERATKKKELVR